MNQINTAYLTCPIRNVIDRFGDKWSLLVLYHIHKNGTLRFGQIYKEMTDVSQKMLSATLKNLERDNLIKRKAYPEVAQTLVSALRQTPGKPMNDFPYGQSSTGRLSFRLSKILLLDSIFRILAQTN